MAKDFKYKTRILEESRESVYSGDYGRVELYKKEVTNTETGKVTQKTCLAYTKIKREEVKGAWRNVEFTTEISGAELDAVIEYFSSK